MPSIELPHGVVHYRTAGPLNAAAPPVLFVHPFLMDGTLWSGVADLLAARGVRSYAPDWPLGAHRNPTNPGTDQSPRGVARQILGFIEALDLHDVTLVGADTGGALCQFLIDTDPSRIGRIVLSNCDAFDTFPPFPFNVVFALLRGNLQMKINLQPMRSRTFRHSPLGFGLLANRARPRADTGLGPAVPRRCGDPQRRRRVPPSSETRGPARRLDAARPVHRSGHHRLGHCRPRLHSGARSAVAAGFPQRPARGSPERQDAGRARRSTAARRPHRRRPEVLSLLTKDSAGPRRCPAQLVRRCRCPWSPMRLVGPVLLACCGDGGSGRCSPRGSSPNAQD